MTYRQGETADDIHDGFPSIPLHDIHAIIAWYLANQGDLDAFIDVQLAQVEARRSAQIAADPTAAEFYTRIRAIRDSKREP